MNRSLRHALMSTSLGLALVVLQAPNSGDAQAQEASRAVAARSAPQNGTAGQPAGSTRTDMATVTVEDDDDDSAAEDVRDAFDDADDDIDEAADDVGDELDEFGEDVEDEFDDLFGDDDDTSTTSENAMSRQTFLGTGNVASTGTGNVAASNRRAGSAAATDDDDESTADEAVDEAEDITEDVGDEIDDTADDVGDELDEFGEDVEDEFDDLFGDDDDTAPSTATTPRQSFSSEPAGTGAAVGGRTTSR